MSKRIKDLTLFVFLTIISLYIVVNESFSQYPRKILYEEFTNTSCGPCASLNPMLHSWLENHPSYVPVIYHAHFPSSQDTMHVYAKDANLYRAQLYKLPFVPYARINGVMAPNTTYPGYPTDTSRINGIIDTMTSSSPISINMTFINNGSIGSVDLEVTSQTVLNGEILYVFITEKHHYYSNAPNGERDFYNLMRRMLPDQFGTQLNMTAGETKSFHFNYSLTPQINFDLTAVAMVQDTASKYVLQSESVFKAAPVSVKEDKEKNNNFQIYPNPASEQLTFIFNSFENSIQFIRIYDITGTLINTIIPNSESNSISWNCLNNKGMALSNGIYLAVVKVGYEFYSKEFTILK